MHDDERRLFQSLYFVKPFIQIKGDQIQIFVQRIIYNLRGYSKNKKARFPIKEMLVAKIYILTRK